MKLVSRHTPAVLAAVMLSACATLSPPDYPSGHPANPDAPPTPVSASSSALDAYRPAIPTKGVPAPASQPESGGGHDHH